ncbi:MAG: thioesterase family protein [Pseudomonadota bacterium]
MISYATTVPTDWIDFNGHMRDGYYVLAVSYANDATMEALGLGPAYLARTGATLYNLENQIRFLREAHEGDPIRVEMWLVAADRKRLHLASVIRHSATGETLAENAAVLLHVQRGPEGPRAAPFPAEVQARVEAMLAEDAGAPAPSFAGAVGLGPK